MMKKSVREDTERFKQELAHCRSVVAGLTKRRQETSFTEKQLTFWMESARFLITELEIWGKLGNDAKYEVAIHRIRKNIEYVRKLMAQLADEQDRDLDTTGTDG